MMNIQSTKLSCRNQTVIPRKVRKALNLRSGDRINWHIVYQGDKPIVYADTQSLGFAKQTRGLGKHLWEGIDIATYIDNLRKEWNELR